jgi:hypothetical protein
LLFVDTQVVVPLSKIVPPRYIREGDLLVGVNHYDLKSGSSYDKLMGALQWKEPVPVYPGERQQIRYSVNENMLTMRFIRYKGSEVDEI